MDACTHEVLQFGSAGFFIFCEKCGCIWSPDDPDSENKARSAQIGEDDFRVKPRQESAH